MTYIQKADGPRRYLAAVEPTATGYPLLSAEADITAPTLAEVATIVNAAFTQWQLIGAAIEAVRLGTKSAVEEATTSGAAEAAAASASWP